MMIRQSGILTGKSTLYWLPMLVATMLVAAPGYAQTTDETPDQASEEQAPGEEPEVDVAPVSGFTKLEKPAPLANDLLMEAADASQPAAAPATTEETTAPEAANDQEAALRALDQERIRDEAAQSARNKPIHPVGYPWIENNGYFRLRLDGFYRPGLGTTAYIDQTQTTVNSSAFPGTITANYANRGNFEKENWVSSANLRLRWSPTIHVMKNLAVVAQVDVLDNLILGSTPDYDADRPDAPLPLFARSQAPNNDSVRVKQAYMVWSPFNPDNNKDFLLSLSGGRMARHWGLGMMDNDGGDIDADYGTYVDRVNVLLRYWNVFMELGFGWASTGATSATEVQVFGQPYDLTNSDNVYDFTFSLFQKPMTQSGRLARAEKLLRGKPVVDWGVYLKYRWQKSDVKQTMDDDYTLVSNTSFDDYTLENRDAWIVTPDAWLKLEWKHSAKELLRVEFEVSANFGHIENTPRFRLDAATDKWVGDGYNDLDILSWAVAFEGEYQWGPVNVGLMTGAASGSNADWWGWRDRNNVSTNKALTKSESHYFNPDYHVDELLFRQVIGTVTDAFYIKPWFMYDFFESRKDALAVGAGLLYGHALEAKATPGNDPHLGLEVDVNLLYENAGAFYVGVTWATLIPFDGLDLATDYGCAVFDSAGGCRSESINSSWAMSIRGVLGARF